MNKILTSLAGIVVLSTFASVNSFAQLKVTEGTETIPTYVPTAPNPMPRFYEGANHQGVQRRMYPYPFDNGLTMNKQDVEYEMVFVENDYIRMAIAPQQGGRIYYAYDKTNGYNWFYHNAVVKPSLIGMVGNWRSGSLAWGYPHHHGPTTVENMEYRIEKHEDGSQTVWINSQERLQRANILIGYTVYPNSSLVEMTIIPRNPTEVTNSFLFWANPAVRCDENYQVIFPPSVKYVTYHGKNSMTSWPIADSPFNRYDYTGLDISRWENTRTSVSFFSWDPREDYFGGYDYKEQAGTAWVGNHYVMPGMKYWADGNNPSGLKTNEGLTDDSGRYIELMAGFYTDNQPDYSWLKPYETKLGTMIWFPIRELDGLKYANRNGALNYFMGDSTIEVRLNTTTAHKAARLELCSDERKIYSETLSISPAEPRKVRITLPAGVGENDIVICLKDEKGAELLRYAPAEHVQPEYDRPEPLKSYKQPEEIESVEELYLTGLRIDQFHSTMDPMPYFKEALRRDPDNSQVNTQLGIMAYKDQNWTLAESYLRKAVDRVQMRYTRARDCESLYYLGLVCRHLGKYEEAYNWLYRASWDADWHTASYLNLARMDCERGDYETALDHINRSITTNTENLVALDLKGMILRKLGRNAEAAALMNEVLEKHKIDHFAMNELIVLGDGNADQSMLDSWMRDDPQAYLELASYYIDACAYEDAAKVLQRIADKGCTYPMVSYALGFCAEMQGDKEEAVALYKKASALPHDYCFPFRVEESVILSHAIAAVPTDAKAHYYLGNLFYEHQPEVAVSLWEKSQELDPSFYIVHRNLALAYKDISKDYPKALEMINKAVACNASDPRLIYEKDVINDLNGLSAKEKYEFLIKNKKTAVKHYETLLRLITRAVEYGKYDEALNLLDNNEIVESEGAREKQSDYLNSYALKAFALINKGRGAAAVDVMNKALNYPVGLYGRAQFAQLYYLTGLAYQKKGDAAKANEYFTKAVDDVELGRGADREYLFYVGLAQKALGRTADAESTFSDLTKSANEGNVINGQFGGRTSERSRYTQQEVQAGLGYLGLGDKSKAKEHLNNALSVDSGLIWARTWLSTIK
ncbi:MAG: DUF5107 domain-containing protein [Candidatus Cryptobacteroides sp.]|nr:DUF5107 domain-containing protein [Bacteroidales bacterium]MDY6158793.1 DUF5107 domain-containing protein [Candidatus Cryptobacteroides sp.]